MLNQFKKQLQDVLIQSLSHSDFVNDDLPELELEIPSDKKHGDYSCNIAMKSARIYKKSPMVIAEQFANHFSSTIQNSSLSTSIERVEIKAPGFVNFYISNEPLYKSLEEVFVQKANYGRLDIGQGERIQLEFVSANPTGPLSIAHARQAAVGDALGNILNFIGFEAVKEYYINDGGNQIRILGESIRYRAMEVLGETIDFPEDCYQGDYIVDMARMYLKERDLQTLEQLKAEDVRQLMDFGATHLLNVIKTELKDFGVNFDVWSHESKIATPTAIEEVLQQLNNSGHLFEKDGALWFRSTRFEDDKDRVVRKSDGSFTYLTPDIVYHRDKFDRGFKRVMNIWGPDHHGYIARIKAAAQALGKDSNAVEVLIVQLATIYRNGEAVSMSTRKGQYVSLREVMDEVGVDASRFFFLMRHIKMHLDFDLDLAKKQTSENPVFYIQYAHARVYSIDTKAQEAGIEPRYQSFEHLNAEEEIDLIKKLGSFASALEHCYEERDPYALVHYLQDLATLFHKFYDRCRVVDQNLELSSERLALCHASRIVLANGLSLLGVSAPESM